MKDDLYICTINPIRLNFISRKFLQLQTKLHKGVCANRTLATIATHDLAKVKGKECAKRTLATIADYDFTKV